MHIMSGHPAHPTLSEIHLKYKVMHDNMKMKSPDDVIKWKRFSTLWALCEGNQPVIGGFLSKVSDAGFDVFFDV